MSAAEELVQKIEALGGVLVLHADRIQYQLLPEDQAPVLINLLRELKPAVLELLRRRRAADQQQPSAELNEAEIAEINGRYEARYGKDLPPSAPCPACHGIEFWSRRDGGFVCENCHPRALPNPEEMASIPALPTGVKLISWNPKPGPVAISHYSVVNDTAKFIQYTSTSWPRLWREKAGAGMPARGASATWSSAWSNAE